MVRARRKAGPPAVLLPEMKEREVSLSDVAWEGAQAQADAENRAADATVSTGSLVVERAVRKYLGLPTMNAGTSVSSSE